MAGSSMTFTYDESGGDHAPASVRKIIASWTSDDSTGAVTGITKKIVGRLIKGVTDPGAAAPTASYDIAVTDEESADVFAACTDNLADRHTSNTETVYFLLSDGGGTPLPISAHPVVCDKLTIAVTNAGNSKTGEIILYWMPW